MMNNRGLAAKSYIASTLLNSPHAELFSRTCEEQAAPSGTTAASVDPFINRYNLRETLRNMADDDQACRTLAIMGESGSSVSCSYLLASHGAAKSRSCPRLQAVAPGGLAAVKIDPRDYTGMGVEERRWQIAKDLLVSLGMTRRWNRSRRTPAT
jgi:hypothetical protein